MIYLAAPLHHENKDVVQERLHWNRLWYETLTYHFDEPIFSPLLHYTSVATGELDIGLSHIWKLDLTALAASTKLVVLPFEGWHQSRGVALEIGFALARRLYISIIEVKSNGNYEFTFKEKDFQIESLYTHPASLNIKEPPRR